MKGTPAQEVEETSSSELGLGLKRSNLQLSALLGNIVMPGDEFILSPEDGTVVLGPGLQLKPLKGHTPLEAKIAVVNKPGLLMKRKPNTFYIEGCPRTYLPYKKDDVVGIITKKSGDQYVLDIGTRDRVSLSKFGFEGATKKNKPDLKIGDVVFGRFMDLPNDYPFEIICVTPSGKAMGLGALENGFVFQIPVHAVQALQSTKKQGGSILLSSLGKITPFEVVVGVNGMIWVKSKNDLTNVLLSKTIQESANLSIEEHHTLLPIFRDAVTTLQGLA